jgi:hypothetical protein
MPRPLYDAEVRALFDDDLPRGPLDRGRLRSRLRNGEPTIGTFIGTASPITAEVCAAVGFDWLLLDLEHGAGGEEQVRLEAVPRIRGRGRGARF